MSEAYEIIDVPADALSRRFGWFLLAAFSLCLGFVLRGIRLAVIGGVTLNVNDVPFLLFCSGMLLGLLGMGVIAIRMALETRQWIVGRDYFARRSDILGFGWIKTGRAKGWRLEIFLRDGNTSYLLNPESGWKTGLTPFYRTSDARQALKLGRQLALVTGWPLRLSSEFERLEKQLEKELQL